MIYKVFEQSMEPSIKEGSYLLINRWYRSLSKEDVVVLRVKDMTFVKRIKKISGNNIFVVGDNEKVSVDSRQFGWVRKEDIIGKLIKVI